MLDKPADLYNCLTHLSHSVSRMKPNLQGLMWFACHELGKEELLTQFMSN